MTDGIEASWLSDEMRVKYQADFTPRHPAGWGQAVKVGSLTVGNDELLVIIAGPCAIESRDYALEVADALAGISSRTGMKFIYKSSFDKANRTSLAGGRGIGMDKGLAILSEVRERFDVPTLTDVHDPGQCQEVAACVDVIQIPAFLCRQTDLLLAAAKTSACVNVKKGQFLAPADLEYVVEKLRGGGADRILATERGVSFGYHTLVNDFRGLEIMGNTCRVPLVFDATHSVQEPGGLGGRSGGARRFVPLLARCAASVGIAAIFMEVHPDPETAPSDGANMVPLAYVEQLWAELRILDACAKARIAQPAQYRV